MMLREGEFMSFENTVDLVRMEYDNACDAYDRALHRDRMLRAENAAEMGGSVSYGKNDRIVDSACMDSAKVGISTAYERAVDAIDRDMAAAEAKLVSAPSTEAANYCLAISGRDDMTEDEVAAALNRYPDHATQHAVLAAAKRSGLHGFAGLTAVEMDIERLRSLRQDVDASFTVWNISGSSEGSRYLRRAAFGGDGSISDLRRILS